MGAQWSPSAPKAMRNDDDDDLQIELRSCVRPLLQEGGKKADKMRRIVDLLRRRPRRECYGRLVQEGLSPSESSCLALVSSCPEAAQEFMAGTPWDAALRVARSLQKGPGRIPSDLSAKEKAAYRLAALLLESGQGELRCAQGVFRLTELPACLAPQRGRSKRKSP
jgi:hypothetical protein